MGFSVETILPFEKEFKKLHKKYPSLKSDLLQLINSLELNPTQGTAIGNDFYKIRLSIASKNKGKSGGARVITFVKIVKQKIYLTAIYDKSNQSSISNKELEWLSDFIAKNS